MRRNQEVECVSAKSFLDDTKTVVSSLKSTNVVWQKGEPPIRDYAQRNNHLPAVLWFTGLSGSGKSTIAQALIKKLFNNGCQVVLLDGDNLRHGLCGDLSFSMKDRSENIRRVSEVAKLFHQTGHIVICTFISPIIKDRLLARKLIQGEVIEIFVTCDIEICRQRDKKGLYAKADAGEIVDFTGISSPYEEPKQPDIILKTDVVSVEQSVATVMQHLNNRGVYKK